MDRGDDSKYAVIKHQLPHGPIIVICQRCYKLWHKPDALPKNYSKVEREQYVAALDEYNKALNFPTDNEMSGNQMFMVTGAETAA